MAYENMTFELILNRMKERISNEYPDLDTREGSIVYNAIATAAIEIAIEYIELANILRESFVDTASRDGLYLKCKEIGLDTNEFTATYSIHKGVFNVEVPIGSRWNCDIYNYTVSEYIKREDDKHIYRMICETEGSEANSLTGEMTPITDYPNGFESAELVECIVEGKDATPDDEIRNIYYSYVRSVSGDGNIGQYETWCDLYDGIGKYKIFPLWNGPNTVKVSILNESNGVASTELIEEFQKYLDPGKTGMGDGVAPIGSIVTVSTPHEYPIDINTTVKVTAGNEDTVKTSIEKAIKDYFAEIAYDKTTIPYFTIGSVILNTEGVESLDSLTISTLTDTEVKVDVTVVGDAIPILRTLNVEVI